MIDEFPGRGPVSSGDVWKPRREDLEILRDLARGQTIDATARRMDLSERTVRRRLRSIADRIGVDTTIEVVVYATRRGYL